MLCEPPHARSCTCAAPFFSCSCLSAFLWVFPFMAAAESLENSGVPLCDGRLSYWNMNSQTLARWTCAPSHVRSVTQHFCFLPAEVASLPFPRSVFFWRVRFENGFKNISAEINTFLGLSVSPWWQRNSLYLCAYPPSLFSGSSSLWCSLSLLPSSSSAPFLLLLLFLSFDHLDC